MDLSSQLARLGQGETASLDQMMPAVYGALRRLAGSYLRRERSGHTLQPTALVHEAYLRLVGQQQVDWRNRAQLLALAARMMRRVLADYAGARNRAKRALHRRRLALNDDLIGAQPAPVDFIDLDRALNRLASLDAQQAAVVELRFFGGLTIDETAAALGISAATVEREWAIARLWLLRQLKEGPDDPGSLGAD